jgi:NAD(P) transhydrogenase
MTNTPRPEDPVPLESNGVEETPVIPSSRYDFDLIVLGSGPGGEKGAAAAAFFKKRVAVIEQADHPGGAAANTGTLPSKTLRETALILSGLRQRKLFGLEFGLAGGVKIQDFLMHERRVKDQERFRIHENLKRHNISEFRGKGCFVDPHTISITPDRCGPVLLRGDKILIATGSYPFRPQNLFPFTNPRVYDSDTILSLYEIPKSLLVVGGGVIGCEYACVFRALGARVIVVEKRDRLLGGMDRELTDSLRDQMVDSGTEIIFCDEVAAVHNLPDGSMEIRLASGRELTVHAILVSSGRSGQTLGLGLEKVGIEVNKRGHIKVDPGTFQTRVPHIYAAGDVIGNPALASTAMAQARMAVAHAFNLPFDSGLAELLPSGIYTIPECSSAGETEEALKEKGIPYVVGRANYVNNARGQIIGDSKGFLKLLFRDDDTLQLLGVHAIGEQATELVHIGLTALQLKGRAELFIHTCYNYPTLSELYKYAAYDALGRQQRQRKEREAEGRMQPAGAESSTGRAAAEGEGASDSLDAQPAGQREPTGKKTTAEKP